MDKMVENQVYGLSAFTCQIFLRIELVPGI